MSSCTMIYPNIKVTRSKREADRSTYEKVYDEIAVLKFSQNSEENTCGKSSLVKLQTAALYNYKQEDLKVQQGFTWDLY